MSELSQIRVNYRFLGALPALLLVAGMGQAAAPTAKQALGLKPIQPSVDFDQPTAKEADECTIRPAKIDGKTAWVIYDPNGQLLRRFGDTNGDNVVDQWSYYQNGMEVYRDIDADFDGKADQYRWFHTAGMRWGMDENENGKIESWKAISPYEVAEVTIQALQRGDGKLFATLLPTKREISNLGLGKSMQEQVTKDVTEALSEFDTFATRQKTVDSSSRFLDFGAGRPSALPAGADGSSQDLVVYENVTALVDNGGKSEQVYLGAMVQVGNTWKLLGLPKLGDSADTTSLFNLTMSTRVSPTEVGGGAPSAEMQELMTQLEKLDDQPMGNPKQQVDVTKRRVAILAQLAELSPAGEEREQWQRQQADMLSAAVQTAEYYEGIERLEKLSKQLEDDKASTDLQAHVEFRRLWAEYSKAQADPKANYPKVQEAWLESLEKFVKAYPRTADTAEALLQLGMAKEFSGEEEDAVEWYGSLSKNFASTDAGKKARGAMRRLDSIGKTLPLAGDAVRGGKVDISQYRGKHVLIHYWATWCEPCKEDIEDLVKIHEKYRRQGFEIVGVNLDSSVGQAQQYLGKNRLPWKNLYDEGGLDGRLANEMGVMTLPLMLLLDDKGQVVNRNMHVGELETELRRVLR